MDAERLLSERSSCRAFLPDPVPGATIEELFGLAQRTASWRNTQAWQVHLVSGAAMERFTKELTHHATADPQGAAPYADLGLPAYTGGHEARVLEAERGLHAALGIAEDEAAQQAQVRENFRCYGAPHTAVITTDRDLGAYGVFDCGGYATTLQLSARALGLGAIVQGVIAMHSGFLRDWLRLPPDRLVVCALSFGYADPDHPANQFRTSREPTTTVVHRIDT